MTAFRKTRPLRQVGRDHLQACTEIVASTPELMKATATAVRSLPKSEIRRASASKEDAASLLYAIVEAFLSGSLPGEAVSYVFHASIFTAALEIGTEGPLLDMAGESAADNLSFMLLMALDCEQYEFIFGGAADVLDKLGRALDKAYYNAQAAGFTLAAKKKMHRTPSSAMENLDIETQLEPYRMQLRHLLPIARHECEGDETRNGLLDTLEAIL
jgi:hypothetical protein